jgi:carbon storage regulator CsrA
MALVLTRRPGQKLILERPRIEIIVDSVVGKTVKLVIKAPAHVKVTRDELVMRLSEAKIHSPEGAVECSE